MNRLIDYIEENITNDSKLTNEEFAKILGVNTLAFSNIFSFLTDTGIKEYIRYRKLTLSVRDLLNGESILDVATKYGYNSATAFSRAFTKFHGLHPSHITEKSVFVNYPKYHFDETDDDLKDINYHFEKIDYKKIYGCKKRMIAEEIRYYAPPFWDSVVSKFPILDNLYPTYSIIEYPPDFRENGCFYWVGAEEPIGEEYIEIENAEFIVFRIEGTDYTKVPKISDLAYDKYAPSINKEILDTVSLEVYLEDAIEIWMPIETD